ncbi:MAG: hypothetical protein ORN54_04490 [Cyclobacteriaceae bacterium]|nr:hypothetical protein [Cyclobacteriaceae bacterium]
MGKAPATNKMFAQWCVDVLLKVLSSFNVFVSGTGRGFETAPLRKHTRWAQAEKPSRTVERGFT